jgi:GNAT superfamily N-acetyltransferase
VSVNENPPVHIRELTAEDRDAVVNLWHEAGLTRPWNDPASDFERALTGATSAVLGAFDGTELTATVMVGHDGHRGWRVLRDRDPTRRRAGLGRRMMSEAERWLRVQGAVKVNVMIRDGDADVLGFYERLGYSDDEVMVRARWLREPTSRPFDGAHGPGDQGGAHLVKHVGAGLRRRRPFWDGYWLVLG